MNACLKIENRRAAKYNWTIIVRINGRLNKERVIPETDQNFTALFAISFSSCGLEWVNPPPMDHSQLVFLRLLIVECRPPTLLGCA